MFAVDPGNPETPAEQVRRRARAGLDRRGLKHVAIAMTIIWGGMAALLAADIGEAEGRMTNATLIELYDHWNRKRGPECVAVLTTGYAYAKIHARKPCDYMSWRLGDNAEVEARRTRFIKMILLDTNGTIFDEQRRRPPKL